MTVSRETPWRPLARRFCGVLAVSGLLVLAACQTTGTANIYYPDGSRAELTFKKGVTDDMDVPAANPTTGRPDAYIRVGTSKVAANTVLEGYKVTGDWLKQYAFDRAKEAATPPPQSF